MNRRAGSGCLFFGSPVKNCLALCKCVGVRTELDFIETDLLKEVPK